MKRFWFTALVAGIVAAGAMPAQAQETREDPAPPPASTEPMPAEVGLYPEQIQLSVDGRAVDFAPAGTEVTVKVTVRNSGEKAAQDVTMTLKPDGDSVSLADGRATFGDIAAGESATGTFVMTVSEKDCTEFAGMMAEITSSLGDTPTKFGFPVACPGPRLYIENVRYEGGDDDQLPEPGERLQIFVTIRNQGRDEATDVRGTLTLNNDDINIVDGSATWSTIEPNEAQENATPFVIEIAKDAETAQPCEPFNGGGGVIVEDKGTTPTDDAVSSDGTVSSDGSTSSGTISPDGSTRSDEPTQTEPGASGAPDGEPGTAGGGSAGSAGTVEPNTGTGTTEPGVIAPEPEETGAPPEPGPADEGTPVGFEAVVKVSASGTSTDLPFGSGMFCALAEGRPQDLGGKSTDGAPTAGAPNLDERAAGAKNSGSSDEGSGALAGVLLAMVASLVLRFRFSA